ncbi:MAG: ATP-binding protein, partial [Desulfuromonadales bacterium]|nr:ATP-binding protein [Desulfuromonadales bacterium]
MSCADSEKHQNSSDNPIADVPAESLTLPRRLTFKAGLAVVLLASLFLFLLSRYNYLLLHTLIELSSIVLAAAVFLIGWNTRYLVRNRFFVILAVGFLAAGAVDLLHTLSYKGMHVFPLADADIAIQLWLIARLVAAATFVTAGFSLGRKTQTSAWSWLARFMGVSSVLVALVWPLELFPVCIVEGQGLTPFKIGAEYGVILLLMLAVVALTLKRRYLNRRLLTFLLAALALNVISELMFTLYVDVYGYTNFLGHLFKLWSSVLVYFALVEGTLRSPYATLFRELSEANAEQNRELERRILAEQRQQISHREISLLYQVSRAMHSTLNLDELTHLTLSVATTAGAGGFERATLFMVNERTGVMQGMLGITREMAQLVLTETDGELNWKELPINSEARRLQCCSEFNQTVVKQRLSLDAEDNPLAQAYRLNQVILAPDPNESSPGGMILAKDLGLGPYACAPLAGRDEVMGVLLVDNPQSGREITPERKHFLELFAGQAGSAMINARLVKRLEMAHDDLQDVQEQLIQGEKMAVLGEMAAQVAHELRNPLVSIGGFAQRLVKRELGDPKANEYADIVAREVRRMEELLGNILAFSKKQMVCLEQCDIEPILMEVFELESENCQKQKIKLVDALQRPLPVIVGDCRQLRQVVLNLMVNARQVMPAEGGIITVRGGRGSLRGDEALILEVEDTGGGIAPEVMRNIFNPFFSTFAKGTGLGLSISHRIVEKK